MFKVSRIEDKRLNLEFSGTLNPEEMEVAIQEFISAAQGIKMGVMMFEIGEFNFPSLQTLGVKLSRVPTLFKLIRNFEKVAIITDKKWLQRVGELEGLLIPGLTIRAFNVIEKAKAEVWLGQ